MKKNIHIENFIGIYDGFITKEECNKAIKVYEDQHKFKNTMDRRQFENADPLSKKDTTLFATTDNVDIWWTDLKSLITNFDMAFRNYDQAVGAAVSYSNNTQFYFSSLKLQKTLPSEGYHIWHVEHNEGFANEPRAFAYTIYLNDVEEGGETEFLHFSKRVKPKAGRIVIWPAGFPYVHRGNPPLAGEKYILTSWMNLR